MSKDLQHIKEIDNYLAGELTPELRNEFEKRLKEDPNLQEEVNVTKQVIEGVQGYAFKAMLSEIHNNLYGKPSDKLE
jgi:anti-sigma factor RsiW